MAHRHDLNRRRHDFARLYAAGPPGVRGDQVAAYRAAGYHPHNDLVASAASARLLNDVRIRKLIDKYHAEADAAVIRQLTDWKLLAPAAQARLQQIHAGYMPDPPDPALPPQAQPPRPYRKIKTRDDIALAKLMSEVSQVMIERAYPARFYLNVKHSASEALARMLGITEDELPDFDEDGSGSTNGHYPASTAESEDDQG